MLKLKWLDESWCGWSQYKVVALTKRVVALDNLQAELIAKVETLEEHIKLAGDEAVKTHMDNFANS